MGGGFGGCIITLVDLQHVESFIQQIQQQYQKEYGKIPDCYTMTISDGARLADENG